ncbi:hypothetical protein JTB14_011847 [Gonioctena quinquepunctata]|nr:hypothetical protein JTB14_011847 [Gonioctena quinquepunctata]
MISATKKPKTFKEFRDELIKSFLSISPDEDGREFVKTVPKGTRSIPSKRSRKNTGHVLEAIPTPENSKKQRKYYRRCKQCYIIKKRKESAWMCRDCIGKPPLCVGKCFQDWHA